MTRKSWNATPTVYIKPIQESEFTEILAELGAIIYVELSSRQLQSQTTASAYTSIVAGNERKLANAK